MKQLVLLRHAAAAGKGVGGTDRDRPLTADGQRAARLIGHRLKSNGVSPDYVACSPARRARETLDGIAEALDTMPSGDFDESLYLADSHALLSHLRGVPAETGCLLLIGHNPGLEELVRVLAGSANAAVQSGLPAAGLAIFQVSGAWAQLNEASARLISFIAP